MSNLSNSWQELVHDLQRETNEDTSETDDSIFQEKHYAKRVKVLNSKNRLMEEPGSHTSMEDLQKVDSLHKEAMRLVNDLYPEHEVSPTLQELVRVMLEKDEVTWARGDWVEYRGNDMRWHLGQVRGVVKQAPDSFDWNDPANEGKVPNYQTFYTIGKESLISEQGVRAPKQALQHMFGKRPWVWQQYALLKTERYVRFQKDHERDFQEVDCQKLADDMWVSWLNDERNQDFLQLYNSYGQTQRSMLLNHLITTFELLDDITENEAWEFEDEDMSIFTYLSVLGSGGMFAIFCAVLQLTIPMLLLINALGKSERFTFELDLNHITIETSASQLCRELEFQVPLEFDEEYLDQVLGKAMIMAVMALYLLTVVPENIIKFYRTAGEASTTYSKLNSLREIVWYQSDDTFLQRVGYKVDRYMNTSYLVLLYGTMLFILYNTDDVLDILLNALAAEFVHQIDEGIAQSDWYDDDNRWITAGAFQLAVQASLHLRVMDNPSEFCRRYDIDPKLYSRALGSKDPHHLPRIYKPSLAVKDDINPLYLDEEEALFQLCGDYARLKGNEDGIEQFEKELKNFSVVDTIYMKYFASKERKRGMFDLTRGYRTWSRWEIIIFLSRIPEQACTLELIDNVPPTRAIKIRKISQPTMRFLWDVLLVVSFGQMCKDVFSCIEKRLYSRIPFHIIDGLFQWLAYILQLIFPLFVALGIVVIPVCY